MITINIQKKLTGNTGEFTLNISEKLERHSFTGIMGKSGSGKTTLFRILSGLETPDTGFISVNDDIWLDTSKNIKLPPQQRKLGYVTQNNALFPNMNVYENLLFALHKNESKTHLNQLIETFELKNLLQVSIDKLSGGQQQRVALAQTLVQKPSILLLDEAFSALDYETRHYLQQFILKTHKTYKLTTLFISHNLQEITALSSEVWKLQNGVIIEKHEPSTFNDLYVNNKF